MARHRMILSLDDQLHSILMELSKETGSPASSFVVALLENAKADMVKIIESVKTARRNQRSTFESTMKPQDLIKAWDTLDNSQLTAKQISVRLPLLVSAKISALCEMYPRKTKTEIIGDLLSAVLDQLPEGDLPAIKQLRA